MVDFSQQDYKTMLFAALADMAAIAEQLGIQEMKEPGQIISAAREMQETEQRLRAEIARLQAIADRGAHSGRHEVSDSRGYTCAPEKRP